jgi:hypothetical protein
MVADGPAVVVHWLGDVRFDPHVFTGTEGSWRIAESNDLAIRLALEETKERDTAAAVRDLSYLTRAAADSALALFLPANVASRVMNLVRLELAGGVRWVPAHPLDEAGGVTMAVVLTVRAVLVTA